MLILSINIIYYEKYFFGNHIFAAGYGARIGKIGKNQTIDPVGVYARGNTQVY